MRSRPYNRAKTHLLKADNLQSILEPADPRDATFTATKVTVTIGPSCQDVETICQLLMAGASCARCDLTWGSIDFHRRSLENLNEAMRRTRKLCAIMLDTVGRELIVERGAHLDETGWPIHDSNVSIAPNSKLVFTSKPDAEAGPGVLPISYSGLPTMAEKGDTIFLGRYLVTGSEDSSVYLTVEEVTETDVVCKSANQSPVVLDGLLTIFHTERSPDQVDNVQNDLPILCGVDMNALTALCADYEIDFVSLSFTRTADDVVAAREYLDSIGMTSTKLLAKLESRQALFNFQTIADASDGLIMSRGNLGLDVLPEKMALVQKAMVQNCNLMGKPLLLTRVVDTMVSSPRPTRAEATDVANAVLDGVDGILLGAETLRGKYPVATVETVLHICKQAEKVFDHNHHFEHLMQEAIEAEVRKGMGGEARRLAREVSHLSMGSDTTPPGGNSSSNLMNLGATIDSPYMSKLESVASSAVKAADKVGASLIIVFTNTGTTANLVSKYRPPMPILTLVVPHIKSNTLSWKLEGRATARQCAIVRGLLPVLATPSPSGDALLQDAITMSAHNKLVGPNDHVVVVHMVHDAFIVKIVSLDKAGQSILQDQPESLIEMAKAQLGNQDEDEDEVAHATPGQQPVGHTTLGAPGQQSLIPPTLGNQMQSMQTNEPPIPRTLTAQQTQKTSK
ncbi:hypothetical protein WJX84_011545 [Apatococcus fuscideae]|uniref:Pyruvate kinase n=1 Tax=Apatococcus fuscideae TaxID=2026836 RepID=A0AAW1SWZ3_9CHLO